MKKVDLLKAFDVLATRYRPAPHNGCKWSRGGTHCVTNMNVLAPKQIHYISRIMDENFGRRTSPWPIRHIDVSKALPNRLWVFHRSLNMRHVNWLIRRINDWPRWRVARLPMLIFYNGDVIVWNGTHRVIISLLIGRRLRARCVDLNAFLDWKKEKGLR